MLCLILSLLAGGIPAGEVDLSAVQAGRELALPAPLRPSWYRALWDDTNSNPDFLVQRCVRGTGAMADTCLAARLLHGEDAPERSLAWLRERALILAVLRELGERRPRGALAVYARLLANERRKQVIRSILLNAFALDERRSCELAYDLAVPGRERSAASTNPAIRRLALRVMHAKALPQAARFRQALIITARKGDSDEAADALELAPPPEGASVASVALERFLPTLDDPDRRDRTWPVVVRALARFDAEADPELGKRLLDLLSSGHGSLVCAVANAVEAGRLPTPPATDTIAALAARLEDEAPGPTRRALFSLLQRWQPELAADLLPAGDPRRRLVRERLRRLRDR